MGLSAHTTKAVTPDQETLVFRQATLAHKTPNLFGTEDRPTPCNVQEAERNLFGWSRQTSTPSVTFGIAVLLGSTLTLRCDWLTPRWEWSRQTTTFTAENPIHPRDCPQARLRGVAPSYCAHSMGR
jgi:hypothetical protein